MAEHVYANYDINHQSEGAEPTIFDSAKGSGPRSLILLRNFLDTGELAEEGRLLDIGCSNGNLLQTFHSLRPRWKLSGAELVDQWKETVLALPGVEAFYSGPNPAYAGRFDVISLSHVLEHIPDPIPFLKAISGHLTPGGRLLLACRTCGRTPAISSSPTIAATSTKTALPTSRARPGSASSFCRRPCCPRSWSPCCPLADRRGRRMSPAPKPMRTGPAPRRGACSISSCSTRCAGPPGRAPRKIGHSASWDLRSQPAGRCSSSRARRNSSSTRTRTASGASSWAVPIVAPAQDAGRRGGVHPDVGGRRREDHRSLEATTGRFSRMCPRTGRASRFIQLIQLGRIRQQQ